MFNQNLLKRLEAGLRRALPAWGLENSVPLALLNISENATYLAEDPRSAKKLILRVHRPDYHTAAEIRSELAWIADLAVNDVVRTPPPIPSTYGGFVVSFSDRELLRHAVAFEYMPGTEPDTTSDLVKWYGRLGEITARLHNHSRTWRRPEGFVRKNWVFETLIGDAAHWGDWRNAPGLEKNGLKVLERTHACLAEHTAAYGHGTDRFGLIHSDMRTANLLVDGDRLGVIDFDDCGLSWFAYDFAASITFMEHEPFIPDLMGAWLEGYRKTSPLAKEHADALPMFVMIRRMQIGAWLASHAETPTAQAMGLNYTRSTVELAERYLSEHS
jgi:Ser/Thr protein kinase RdoA (MazF antagonist)